MIKEIEVDIERLKEVVDQFEKAHVLVIGDFMLDKFVQGTVSRLSPEAPVPVVEVTSELFRPGGAANAISNIIALGGKVIAVGVVGDDWNGKKLIELLKRDGVDTDCIVVSKERQTTVKTRIIAEQQQVVRIDREKRGTIEYEHTQKIMDFLNDKITEVDAILVSDYDKGVVTNMLLDGLIPLAKKFDKPVVAHPKVMHFLDYRGVTLVNSNLERASIVTGIRQINETSIRNMGQWLLTQLECDYMLITRSDEGMSLFAKSGGVTHIPAIAKRIHNVMGISAGDTVTGVITLSLASGVTNMTTSAILANTAAGIMVGRGWSAIVTRGELKDKLNILKDTKFTFAQSE